MARLDASLTQGLMNPTYRKELGQVGGMLGGMGGRMREAQKAKEMAGMTTMGLLDAQREAASTPAEAIAAGMAQENFSRQEDERLWQEEERKEQTRQRKQTQAQSSAESQLSALELKRKALVKAGKAKEADNLLGQMEKIAKGAMLKLGDYVEDVDSASRYINVGNGELFDTFTGKRVTNPTDAQRNAAGPEMAPKDYLTNVRQEQQNKATWKPEAFQQFLTDISSEGVYGSAAKHLTKENHVNFVEETANREVSQDARAKLGTIASIKQRAAKYSEGDEAGNIRKGVAQSFMSMVSGSEAVAVYRGVDELKASLSFDELTRMREASKTGGALGSITERELEQLGRAVKDLSPDNPDFLQNLDYIERYYQQILDETEGPEGGSTNFVEGTALYESPVDGLTYDFDGSITGTRGSRVSDGVAFSYLETKGIE